MDYVTDIEGQDRARGILAVNPYPEGSLEWHAWGLGFDYSKATGGIYGDTPLSGEWADQPTPATVSRTVESIVGFELDFEDVDYVAEAYELGYATWLAGWR